MKWGLMMSKGTVLIIDDEEKIRTLLQLYLMKNDYEVLMAATGAAGLREIEKSFPDVVILDIMLPDMCGLEVCKKIRLHCDIPVIYLSCLQESETIISGLEYGGDDYVTKPFDPNVVVAKVNALLRRIQSATQPEVAKRKTGYEPLTYQEGRILFWMEKGYTNKEIAFRLNLTEGTVKMYNHLIYQKLQVKNRTQAIVRAKEEKLI